MPSDTPSTRPQMGDEAREHDLKVHVPFFGAVESGTKPFELRRNDRDYRVGDFLRLREYLQHQQEYTGRETTKVVTFLLNGDTTEGANFGVQPGFVALGICEPSEVDIAALSGRTRLASLPQPPAGGTGEDEGLRKRIVELEALVYVPGAWRCPKCQFTLFQRTLHAKDLSVSVRDEAGEKCPNCETPLWRVTERQERIEAIESNNRLGLENAALRDSAASTPAQSGVVEALREMVYEATHLSSREDDGSHRCRITGPTLAKARDALSHAPSQPAQGEIGPCFFCGEHHEGLCTAAITKTSTLDDSQFDGPPSQPAPVVADVRKSVPIQINMQPREVEALERLVKAKEMSADAVIRSALRLYQLRERRGEEGYTEIKFAKLNGELYDDTPFGCMGDDE